MTGSPHRREVLRAACACIATVVTVTGCSAIHGRPSQADCDAQVRADGITYTSHGLTQQRPERHESADEPDCHDVGRDAEGSVFTESPRQVATWTFDGYSPEEVLGVRFERGWFRVFVADSIETEERDRIYDDLNQDPG